ncbi:Alvin_2107 family globule sulfur oxidation protein [Thioflexithrix psekupsensis]|uniref:Uncharacterized protein n=1 Tax=Thioflexithrix psekupsensis TaxID=1570016 RepID=A0A251X8F2_9GAMM|nr:hypothetical protein [Thioflexithrix psekupsensis]OUD14251.1 hypothetical protein TPSD3_07960 [Thioflexithrix psekupsensis]
MDKTYYETISTMEKMNVDREYRLGWMGGYLENPMREEQRLTEAYEAGYADGQKRDTKGFEKWVSAAA